ncbi:MAG: conjugative transfer ATPase [Methylococcaceae bacterium]|nr:conjugative transfer ATPase [Methylococcaceae bacterium]
MDTTMTKQAVTTIDDNANDIDKVEYSSVRAKSPKKGFGTVLKRFFGYYPKKGPVPLEKSDKEEPILLKGKHGLARRSFLSHVPFKSYDSKNKQVLTVDGERAVFLDILPTDVEGLTESLIDELSEKIKLALDSLDGETEPWIIQVYQNDEDSRALIHDIKNYSKKNVKPSQYTKEWFSILERHLTTLSNRKGVFKDVKGMKWRSRYRRVRMIVYRKKRMDADILNAQMLRLTEALDQSGVSASRMSGKDIVTWLMPWYSGEQEDAYDFLESVPYPEEAEKNDELPPSFDLGEMCLRNRSVYADEVGKYWKLGKRYCRFLTLEPYRSVPKTGHWVLEGNSGITPFDRMPDGVVLMYTIIIDPQDKVEAQIELVTKNAIGDGETSRRARKECKKTLKEMSKGHRLVTFFAGIYIDGVSENELNARTTKAIASANGAGFDVIEPLGEHGDELILDSYVRGLPLNFDPHLDKKVMKRARKAWDSHMAKLLPLYTRGRGSQNHGIHFNSVGGEPLSLDPLGDDRSENGHLFLFGGTGSGKTTTLITMLMQLMATRNPRMFLITSLPTFYLLGDFFKKHGKTVNRVQITESSQPSLPPFSDITKYITDKPNVDNGINDSRDYIGEAELAASLMITEGNEEEMKHYRMEDKALVKQAIIFAAETVVAEGRKQALTEDIVFALNALAKDEDRFPSETEREKLGKFSTIMNSYTTGIEGELFNREGEAWPEVDVTIVELGMLAKKGNEAKLAISVAGLMTMINHVVEKNQRVSKRNTITVIDEAHILLKNPLTGPILNSIVAMWRTYGAWLWIATQKLQQIPDSAKELINQPEWWIGLCLKPDEIERVSRFRQLSKHQIKLLNDTRKEPKKYTEGGIISTNFNTVIRIVPPPITLALAFTEQEEINERVELAKNEGITELEAAYRVADGIEKKRMEFDG